MYCGQDATLGVDTIPSMQQAVRSLSIDDEELCENCFVADSQIHV
jgi:hypothetical protein